VPYILKVYALKFQLIVTKINHKALYFDYFLLFFPKSIASFLKTRKRFKIKTNTTKRIPSDAGDYKNAQKLLKKL
tara:strand:+ start:16 stop:240 length:225 start_codon:yes stop_codon:yes gene_type:complete